MEVEEKQKKEIYFISNEELKAAIEIANKSLNPVNHENVLHPQFSISIMNEVLKLREEISAYKKRDELSHDYMISSTDQIQTLTEANRLLELKVSEKDMAIGNLTSIVRTTKEFNRHAMGLLVDVRLYITQLRSYPNLLNKIIVLIEGKQNESS